MVHELHLDIPNLIAFKYLQMMTYKAILFNIKKYQKNNCKTALKATLKESGPKTLPFITPQNKGK